MAAGDAPLDAAREGDAPTAPAARFTLPSAVVAVRRTVGMRVGRRRGERGRRVPRPGADLAQGLRRALAHLGARIPERLGERGDGPGRRDVVAADAARAPSPRPRGPAASGSGARAPARDRRSCPRCPRRAAHTRRRRGPRTRSPGAGDRSPGGSWPAAARPGRRAPGPGGSPRSTRRGRGWRAARCPVVPRSRASRRGGHEAPVVLALDDPDETSHGVGLGALGRAEWRPDGLEERGEDLGVGHVPVQRERRREPHLRVGVAQGLPERRDQLPDLGLQRDQRPGHLHDGPAVRLRRDGGPQRRHRLARRVAELAQRVGGGGSHAGVRVAERGGQLGEARRGLQLAEPPRGLLPARAGRGSGPGSPATCSIWPWRSTAARSCCWRASSSGDAVISRRSAHPSVMHATQIVSPASRRHSVRMSAEYTARWGRIGTYRGEGESRPRPA